MSKKYKYRKTFTFDGKRYFVWANTETEAIKKMALKQRDLEEGRIIIDSSMLLKDWANVCIKTYKTRQKECTRNNFEYLINHYVLSQIGVMPIKSIKPIHCQNVLNNLSHLSQYVIDQSSIAMNFVFKKAVENKLVLENPAANLIKPKGTKNNRRTLSAEEESAFLTSIDSDKRFILFELMYFCGCRPGEAMSVLGSDICNIDGEYLLHIRGTKTAKSDRFVPIPDILYSKIKGTSKTATIVVNEAGKKFDSSSYKRAWKSLKRRMNIVMGCKVYRNELIPPYPLSNDIVPYCFRHTYCTNLQKKGIDVRVAQYLMGHADIKMTANIYTHNDISSAVEASKKINGKI